MKGGNVFVDTEIFEWQDVGGISRIFSETLPIICDLDPDLRILLVQDGNLKQQPPTHKQIAHLNLAPLKQFLRPKRLWAPAFPFMHRLARRMQIPHTQRDIWLATYYRLPPIGWHGKHVVFVYDLIYENFVELFSSKTDRQIRRLKRISITNADVVICISETTRRDLLEYYKIDPTKTRVVSLGVSQSFRISDGDCGQTIGDIVDPYFIYVGQRSHHKNFSSVLEAFSRWDKRGSASIVAVGSKCSEEERELLERLGISSRVRFLQKVSDSELACLYKNAVGLVYPSLYEGFGIPLLEAMSSGCLILASRIPSTEEVAGDIPVYFDPQNIQELVHALNTAYEGKGKAKKILIGKNLAATYSWNKTARQLLDFISEQI